MEVMEQQYKMFKFGLKLYNFMNTYQLLIDHIAAEEFDSALNVAKTKIKYFNNQITTVDDDYQPAISEEIVFWYEKVNGQNFINLA